MTHRNLQEWERIEGKNKTINYTVEQLFDRVNRHTDWHIVEYLSIIKQREAEGIFLLVFCKVFNTNFGFYIRDENEYHWKQTVREIKDLIDTFRKSTVKLDFLLDRKYPLFCLKKTESTATSLDDTKKEYFIMKLYEDHIIPYVTKVYRDVYRMPQVPLELRQKIQSFVTGAGTLKAPKMNFKAKKKSKKRSRSRTRKSK